MTLEAHLSNPPFGVHTDDQQQTQLVSVTSASIVAGMALTVGLLIISLPFSDQIAMSLSLLS